MVLSSLLNAGVILLFLCSFGKMHVLNLGVTIENPGLAFEAIRQFEIEFFLFACTAHCK